MRNRRGPFFARLNLEFSRYFSLGISAEMPRPEMVTKMKGPLQTTYLEVVACQEFIHRTTCPSLWGVAGHMVQTRSSNLICWRYVDRSNEHTQGISLLVRDESHPFEG